MLRKILGEDAIIRLACNGKECLDMATSGGVNNLLSFDIILMDVQVSPPREPPLSDFFSLSSELGTFKKIGP